MKTRTIRTLAVILTSLMVVCSCGGAGNGTSSGTASGTTSVSSSGGSADSGSGGNENEGVPEAVEAELQEEVSAAQGNSSATSITEQMLYGTYESQYYRSAGSAFDERVNESFTNLKFEDRIIYPEDDYIKETIKTSSAPGYVHGGSAFDFYSFKAYEMAAESKWQELYSELAEQVPGKEDEYLANLRALYNTNYIDMNYITDENRTVNSSGFYYTYTIDKNIMHCRRFTGINDDYTIRYCDPEIEEDYEVGFDGCNMVINRNGCSCILMPFLMKANLDVEDKDYSFSLIGSVDRPENAFQNIWYISIFWDEDRTKTDSAYLHFTDGTMSHDAEAVFTEPNTVTVSWNEVLDEDYNLIERSGTVAFNFLSAFNIGQFDHALIAIDDAGNTYPYIYGEKAYLSNTLSDNLDDSVSTDYMSDQAKSKAASEQKDVVSAIQSTFDDENVKANVDELTGTVRFDSNILFAVDSDEITEEGKAGLDDFLEVYMPVMKEQVESGSVAKIQIDGHTDTSGDHDYNQDLSERRARAVADYVIEEYPDMEPYIISKGYSYDKPIFSDDGSVDMDASRRVEFRFILDID